MTTILATVRPDEQNFPLFLHILGATVLVGGMLTASSALAFARGDARLLRLGYWTLLTVSLPAYILMRIGAEWLYVKQGWDDVDDERIPTWLDIGFIIANVGAVALLLSLVLGGIGVYQLRHGKGSGLLKATLVLSLLILAALVVAAWAMAGKPN